MDNKKGHKKENTCKTILSVKIIKEKTKSPPTLAEIFGNVRFTADIPDDFEEYCEISFLDPSDEICRIDYSSDRRRADFKYTQIYYK